MTGIIGTAGHIDHGKTALIGALTGEETDRLPEERRRGISIDLGFSRLDTERGRLGVVDVPGHEDFIRNMLAGATGIDLLLLVVAADEGVMPQTREHVAIAGLLGVPGAVVALTKTDLVDPEWLGLVHDDLADFLAGTPYAGAPVVPTSTVTGEGIEELRATLERHFAGTVARPDDLFRMPVDRAFTVRGTGTVVTGTVWGGTLRRDAAVRLLPGEVEARVRGLQVHGEDAEVVTAGQRAAVALAGVDRDAIARGMTVVDHPAWRESSMLTVRLRVLPGSAWSIEPRQRLRVHLGTAEVMGRCTLLDGGRLDPGDTGWAQLRLEAPLLARARDRFVVRSYSPVTTIGGGRVVEPLPARRNRLEAGAVERFDRVLDGEPAAALDALLDHAGGQGVAVDTLPVVLPASPGQVEGLLNGDAGGVAVAGDRAFSRDAHETTRLALVAAVDAYHDEHPLHPGMEVEAVRRAAAARPGLVDLVLDELLAGDGPLVSEAGRIRRRGWTPQPTPAQAEVRERIARALARHGPAAPRLDELASELGDPGDLRALVELLEAEGRVARLEHDLFIDREALDGAVSRIRDRFAGRDDLSPGDFREAVDVSRRHLMPLLAYLDREGVTTRTDGGRTVNPA